MKLELKMTKGMKCLNVIIINLTILMQLQTETSQMINHYICFFQMAVIPSQNNRVLKSLIVNCSGLLFGNQPTSGLGAEHFI
jgi:hypothetical protein